VKIGISTGACFPFLSAKGKQVKLISEFLPEINGLEFIFPRPLDLMMFKPRGRIAKALKQFEFVSIHYPFSWHVAHSGFSERQMLSKIKAIDRAVGVKHIVVHPRAAKNWKNFQNLGLEVLLENQTPVSGGEFKTPAGMKRLLRETGFGMCLDLNHAIGNGVAPENFLGLKSKIKQVHVNATEGTGTESHNFVHSSSLRIKGQAKRALKGLRKSVWMIEPKSKVSPRRKLAREISFLKSI